MPGEEQALRVVLDRLDAIEDRLERGIESTRVLVEDIRSDNRTTIEAVEAARVALEQRIERLDQEARARGAARIEERVAAIEKRLA